jgi:hypothetical protein
MTMRHHGKKEIFLPVPNGEHRIRGLLPRIENLIPAKPPKVI